MPVAATDSSDGESAEGELLSPGSSMSSLGFEVDRAHTTSSPAAGRDRHGSSNLGASSSVLRQGGVALGMDTIEEEAPGALQDSPFKRPPAQQRQRPQSPLHRSCEDLVQQQLHPQARTARALLESLPLQQQQQQQQQQSLMQASSGWQSGVGSLTLGMGAGIQEAQATPYVDDEAVSQVRWRCEDAMMAAPPLRGRHGAVR